ncbi:hypothetical protein QFC24_003732 [Naganishia onofrii]|uniref:Uncharacterized protein n=1 Tax=Naganishia onofrii TaxID=1851511 RepID=A0ACC2XHU5_9TREE|nr:hypothetical protein QFC24_003732 [Naganishia onofrii]
MPEKNTAFGRAEVDPKFSLAKFRAQHQGAQAYLDAYAEQEKWIEAERKKPRLHGNALPTNYKVSNQNKDHPVPNLKQTSVISGSRGIANREVNLKEGLDSRQIQLMNCLLNTDQLEEGRAGNGLEDGVGTGE